MIIPPDDLGFTVFEQFGNAGVVASGQRHIMFIVSRLRSSLEEGQLINFVGKWQHWTCMCTSQQVHTFYSVGTSHARKPKWMLSMIHTCIKYILINDTCYVPRVLRSCDNNPVQHWMTGHRCIHTSVTHLIHGCNSSAWPWLCDYDKFTLFWDLSTEPLCY